MNTLPTSATAIRVADLFHRRSTTPWSEREIRQFKKLIKQGSMKDSELELIERYYYNERRKEDEGIHRRDLYTFLNNYTGELDRAIAWNDRVVKRKPKKVVQREPERELTDEQIAKNKEFIAEQMKTLREKLCLSPDQPSSRGTGVSDKKEVPEIVREAIEMFSATLAQ